MSFCTSRLSHLFTNKISTLAILAIMLTACGGGGGGKQSSAGDNDGDGLSNQDETSIYLTDPDNPDSDGDALSDGQEIQRFFTNPLLADSDGDDFADGDEIEALTDPLNRYSNITEQQKLRFSIPIDLTDSEGHAYAPSLALDASGNPHAVWHDDIVAEDVQACERQSPENPDECAQVGGSAIFYSRSNDSGTTYTTAINISQTVGTAEFAEIAVAGDNDVYVVWKDTAEGYASIYFNASDNGGTSFGTAVSISARNTAATNPDIAVDSKGNILVSWYEVNAVKVAKSTDKGRTFQVIASLPALDLPMQTDICVDDQDELHLVYENIDPVSSGLQVYHVATSSQQTVFGTPKAVSQSTSGVMFPRVATNAKGMVFVAWTQYFGPDAQGIKQNEEIMLARSTNRGAGFAAPVNVSSDTAVSGYPDIFVAADDDLYIVWQDTSEGNYETNLSYSEDDSASFKPRINIAPSEDGSLISTVVVNARKQIFVTWDDNRFGTFDAVASKGEVGQAAVAEALLASSLLSPNGDGVDETLGIEAWFTEPLRWMIEVYKEDESTKVKGRIDKLVKTFAGSQLATSASATWDGITHEGLEGAEGKYYLVISGETRDGRSAVKLRKDFNLSRQPASDLPKIETFLADTDVFAPDNDGRREEVRISAGFNKDLQWTITIADGAGRTIAVRSDFGSSALVLWNGVADDTQTVVEDGTYTVTLEAIDAKGRTATGSFNLAIDRVAPVVSEPVFSPVANGLGYVDAHGTTPTLNDDILRLSFSLSESAVVTTYVYDDGGVSLIKVLDRQSYYTGEDGNPVTINLAWDGTTGGDNGSTVVAPGRYSVRIWARDFAANRYEEYPIIREFEVR